LSLVPGFPCLPGPKSASGRCRFFPVTHETGRTRTRDPQAVSWPCSSAYINKPWRISRKGRVWNPWMHPRGTCKMHLTLQSRASKKTPPGTGKSTKFRLGRVHGAFVEHHVGCSVYTHQGGVN